MVEASLLNMIETIAILIGVSLAVYELRNIGKARKIEAISQFSSWWTRREDMISQLNAGRLDYNTYEEFIEKYSFQLDPEASADSYLMAMKYNFTGKMVMDGIIDPEFVWQALPTSFMIGAWEKYRLLVEVWRERYNDPQFYYPFEYLYDITKKQFPNIVTREKWLKEQSKTNS